MNPLLAQFVAEAADLLADVDDGLLQLEQDPHDADLVNAVFRAAHTFKGSSGLFDLPELTRLTHAAEDLLDAVRAGRLDLDSDMVDNLLAAFDAVRSWMPNIESHGCAPREASGVGQSLAMKLRAPLGGGAEQQVATAEVRTAAAGPLPGWLRVLAEEPLQELVSWLDITGATVRALRYQPDSGCFFRGEDPLHLVSQVPAIDVLDIGLPPGLVMSDSYDEFDCQVQFTVLTRAGLGELEHIFRYIPDQAEIVEVTAAGLRDLLDGAPAASADLHDGPAGNVTAAPVDGALSALFQAQHRMLELHAGQPASLVSAAEAILRLASALGQQSGGDASADVLVAAQASVATGEPARLLGYLDTYTPTSPAQLRLVTDTPAAVGVAEPDAPSAPSTAARVSDGEGRHDDTGGARILKIEQSKVDRLLDLVGELVVAKNSLPFVAVSAEEQGHRALARRIKDEYAVVSRVTEELQQAVMDVRMLPVSTAFARAPRLVRDLSRKLGKQVRLVQEGEDSAADKDVIEMLAEPLVHLVRNSLDHGIETPADRAAAGKNPEATLTLRATPDGDAVVVSVIDDGRGINTDAVRRKAYERGIIDEVALESMPDAEAAELIFAAGFSTAETISDVSGRGVGMDAVRSSIEKLGGTVSVDSRPGLGLTVALRLPLTMAVSRVLLITAAGQRFGVPLDDVIETVRVPAGEITRVAGHQVLLLRQDIVPLSALRNLLALSTEADPTGEVSVLVVKTPTGPLGIVVDDFHKNTDVILKPLDGLLASTPGYCGTALLGDGLVLLVLDVKELNNRAAAAV